MNLCVDSDRPITYWICDNRGHDPLTVPIAN
jgi:hypothetical protein